MPRITNKRYQDFTKEGIIDLLEQSQIEQALKNVTGKHIKEGQALICAAYLTGARPNEYLLLKSDEVTKEDSFIKIFMRGSKGGKARIIHVQYKNKFAKFLYNYANSLFPGSFLFYNYSGKYTKKVLIKPKNKPAYYKIYETTTGKLTHYFKKWFSHIEGGINPYFLRHNRFSSLAEKGATHEEIKQIKGAESLASVEPYLHMSAKTSKKLARFIK